MWFQIWRDGFGEFSKVYQVWAKKKYRVIFHETEQWCKNWNKPYDLGVSKMAFGELDGILLEHSKVWKTVQWWAHFVQKYNF